MNMNKKLIAVAAAGLIGVGGFAQVATAATGNAKATLAGAISLTETTGLNFGGIVNGLTNPATATVQVFDTGAATTYGAGVSAADASATRGIFSVSGDAGLSYTVSLPASPITITDGASTMNVGTFTSSSLSGTNTLVGGTDTLYVGATLTVSDPTINANGVYLGTYTINVNYN